MPHNDSMHKEIKIIDGVKFKQIMLSSLYWLKEQQSFIDSLNVFPVPDGDTGTNMYLTFKEAVSSIEEMQTSSVGGLASALSKGALMGARGNSGVILSQLIRGFALSLKNKKVIRTNDFAKGLKKASEVAYHGVLKPVEGTILTVSRETAEEAMKASEKYNDFMQFLPVIIKEAGKSLNRTPDLLQTLKEAEVVDAGGQGYFTLLEGMLKGLKDEEIEYTEEKKISRRASKAETKEDIKFTYCTQMLIGNGQVEDELNKKIEKMRRDLQSYGDSIMVVGSDGIIKVHVHTNHPGVVLEYGLKQGSIFDIKIDNMKKQNEEIKAKEMAAALPDHPEHVHDDESIFVNKEIDSADETDQMKIEKNYGIISVGNGEGIKNILKELGVDTIIEGGQSMNPSTNDFIQALEQLNLDNIIILPNNKNIISAAKQAAEVSQKNIVVVETRTIPQAVAALMVYDDNAELNELKEKMENEVQYVKTLEITKAVKDSKINGMEIKENDVIGISDGEIVNSGRDYNEVILDLLKRTVGDEELITIYYGQDIDSQDVEEIRKIVEDNFDFDEIEIYSGGQPLYPYIISLE
ncbi:MAG: DAK2 domain-containing protein [Bacillota bacterium]